MSDKNEEQFEADELIESLYQDNAGEQPPLSLDNLILAKARGQTRAEPVYRKTRWHVPVVLCMVPAIALAGALTLGNFGQGGDGSYEGAKNSNIYSTEEFTLHIPRARDAITRPERPDFSEDNVALASSASQVMTTESTSLAQAAPETREMIIAKAEAEISVAVARPELDGAQAKQSDELVTAAAAPWSAPIATICDDEHCMVSDMDSETGMQAGVASDSTDEALAAEVQIASAPAPAPVEENYAMSAPAAADMVAMSRPPAELGNTQERAAGEKIQVSYQEHYQECPPRDQRAEMCPGVYEPVCAERDTGMRCVMAPCTGATEMQTYSNACSACADLDVYGYFGAGACDDLSSESTD